MAGRINIVWTDEKKTRFLAAVKAGAYPESLADTFGVTPTACRAIYRRLMMSPAKREVDRAKNLERWRKHRERERAARLAQPLLRLEPAPRMEIPQRVLEDRDLREATPYQSLTSAFFGDPKPGWGADQRLLGST